MNVKYLCRWLIIPMLFALCASCTKDIRPKYVAPILDDSKLAIVKSTSGMFSGITSYLEEVDGAHIDRIYLIGTTVKVTPGEHDCRIEITESSPHSSYTWHIRFKHVFVAGHVYEVGVKQWPTDRRARIIDRTTQQEIIVQ